MNKARKLLLLYDKKTKRTKNEQRETYPRETQERPKGEVKMNIETLKPIQNHEKAVINGRKGGLKSGEVRKQKKLLKEVVKDILNQKPSKEDIKELCKRYESLDVEEISIRTLLIDKLVQKALKGDIRACIFICELSNELPRKEEQHEVKLPIFNIEIVDNTELEKEFFKLKEEEN